MISILMATFNGSKFIVEQLESIKEQTVKPDEVIICDDNSTDNTAEIVRDFINKNQLTNWKLITNETNLGHYKTFIKLSRLVNNDYVFFSDQDDIWALNKIEVMLPVLKKNEVSMVFCQSNFIDENGNIYRSPFVSNSIFENDFHSQITKWPSGYQTAIKRSIIQDVLKNRFDEMPGFDFHDVLFGLVSIVYGKVIKIDYILDSHRIHKNNVTKSISNKSFKASKRERIEYVTKVIKRFASLEEISNEKNAIFTDILTGYKDFNNSRLNFLASFSVKRLITIWNKKKYYTTNKDLIADIIYALNLSKIARKLIEIKEK